MPAIGDQVASLEHDHTEALAKIDSLTAQLAAVTSANTSLTAENAALNKYADEALAKIDSLTAMLAALTSANASLTTENAALNKYADDIKAMVESVASGALNMLKAARAPIVAAVEKVATEVVANVKTDVAKVESLFEPTPPVALGTEQLPATIVQTDSGDEQPIAAAATLAPLAGFEQLVSNGAAVIAKNVADVEARIADIPEAVERMLHHSEAPAGSASSAPPVTKIRGPVDMTMIVEHDGEGLPMFLRRGTVFDNEARARLFG